MIRLLLVVALSLFASSAIAGEPSKSPAKPIGTWKRRLDGGSWAIAIENSRIVFTSVTGKRVTTLSAPRYEISDEGVLFGYVRATVSVLEEEDLRYKGICPFAFRIKVNAETLTVSDMNMHGLDAGALQAMTGDYEKEPTVSASKPQPDMKR